MKKILILTTILFAMVSCNEQTVDTNIYHEVEITNDVYKVNVISTRDDPTSLRVVIIDSCEYIIGRNLIGDKGYGYLSHKGNCKYCAERRKRELQNLK